MRRKLYSAKGTYLGVVTYPQKWDDQLQAFGTATVRIQDPPPMFRPRDASVVANARTMTISHCPLEVGAVHITGVTIEEFERFPDCAFEISISYLRSLLP